MTIRLGFNTRVSFPTGEAARSLRAGRELFQAAEALGYQSGWAYQRHFDNYLSSPLPFFAAAGQHTTRITLGSAVIPARYQEPILLAEAAGTADLLTGGRLQLAFSSGTDIWDAVFGGVHTDARTEGQRRLAASVLPGTTPQLRAAYAAYDLDRRTHGPAASRPRGALEPTLSADLPDGIVMSPVYHGEPGAVTEAVLADPGLSVADELVLFLPPAFGLADNVRLLTDLAQTVAPALGWTPAR